jgi:putative toxin-antitoxin system antitoxin component (TIGR02293 family)
MTQNALTFETTQTTFLPSLFGSLGKKAVNSPGSLMESVQKGFPFSTFEAVQKELDISQKELSEILGIPTRTLSRRKDANHLSAVESDRLYRIIRIVSFTVEVLDDLEKARKWLKHPNIELGGETPLALLDTDIGVCLVEDVLNRIKYGIYG